MAVTEHIQFVREISVSGIARVWEGYDQRLGRKVLVKTLHPQLMRDTDLRARFEREARAVASLSHPNVVRIYELCVDEEELSLVFEFIEGRTLRQLLNECGLLPLEVAIGITQEILQGLAVAHEKGIIHRDLKPENVLLSQRGEVKIADFGLAMVRDLPRLTLEGAPVGTAKYMAPEQVTGEEVTPRTDLFALGLILFEMLTGQAVLKGRTWQECLQELLLYQLPRFSDYRTMISPEIESVLAGLLERSPARRFESAHAVREALAAVSKPVQLPPPDLLRDFMERSPMKAVAEIRPVAPKSKRRKRSLMLVGIPLLVIILAIIAYFARERPRNEPVPITSGLRVGVTEEIQGPPVPKPPESPEVPLVQPAPRKEQAQLLILCEPWTEITIDSQKVGITPLETLLLPPGSHQVHLKNDSIPVAIDTVITLEVDQLATLSVDLYDFALPARLLVVCRDWGDVSIDGKKYGRTPFGEVELRACRHKIILENEYFPVKIDTVITLRAGEADTLLVSFYDRVGLVRVVWVNPGADIFVDGVKVGSTPIARPIPLTLHEEHTIRLENPNYPPWEKRIQFPKADTLEVRVDLTKSP